MPYSAVRYQKRDGRVPYAEWMKLLQKKDVRAAAKIDISINRARAGNFGDHKFERDGVGTSHSLWARLSRLLFSAKWHHYPFARGR